jgi:histidinol-phosphate/aromatic aminotransferase/cobyric acid decarboxylase-like protein
MEFTGAPSQSGRAMSFGNFAVLRSFSFFHCLAGLPLGYLIADPAIIDRVKQFFDPGPVSAVASAGALASLRDRGFYKRTVEYIEAEKAYFKEKIGKAEGMEIIDRGGSFLVLRLLKELPDLVERLLERRILIDSFEDSEKTLCLRLPIRRHRENARFAKTLLRIVGQRKPLPAPEVC